MIYYFLIGILALAAFLFVIHLISQMDSSKLARYFRAAQQQSDNWETGGRNRRDPRKASAKMSRREALRTLGLDEDANEEEIKAAHRKLMQQHHPDQGGHPEMASLINRAKDVLLDK